MFFKKKHINICRNKNLILFNNYKVIIENNYIKFFYFNKFFIIIKNKLKEILKLNFLSKEYNILYNLINIFLFNNFTPYKKSIFLHGVGNKFIIKKNYIYFFLGFSHPKIIFLTFDFYITLDDKFLNFYNFNKQRLGEYVYLIKKMKLLDSYKGKGVRIINEKLIFKNVKKK